jgi:murein L,D-transpeptidase YafK
MRRAWLAVLLVAVAVGATTPTKPQPPEITRVVVLKSERKLMLMSGDTVVKTYRVSLGGQPIGAKTQQGDHKTPEGVYLLDSRNPYSTYHLALHISYPNAADRAQAAKRHVSPGGAIMLHGLPKGWEWVGPGEKLVDWTDGCIAVTNPEIEEIWRLVKIPTPIEIKP